MFVIIFVVIWILKDNLHHFPQPVFIISMILALMELALYLMLGILTMVGLSRARKVRQ